MNIYRFKVSLKNHDDLLRVIDIPGNYTFEGLHLAILSAVNFDDSQLASFYVSDDKWEKGQEITLLDMGDDAAPLIMQDARLDKMLKKKGEHLIYVYDFILMWTFYLELHDIIEPNPEWEYPMLVEEEGPAPDQYGEKGQYPDEISEEDQKIIEQIKKQGFDFNLGDDSDEDNDDDLGFDDSDERYF